MTRHVENSSSFFGGWTHYTRNGKEKRKEIKSKPPPFKNKIQLENLLFWFSIFLFVIHIYNINDVF